jgi:gas vesicle protein
VSKSAEEICADHSIIGGFVMRRDEEMEMNDGGFNKLSWILAGAFLGSVVAFYFDPISGRRRRAYVRDQMVRSRNDAIWYAEKHSRDLGNRMKGVVYESTKMFKSGEDVDDSTLVQRVRSAMGRKVRHPRALHIDAREGEVTLTGYILSDEVEDLLNCVHDVPGVRSVRNRLEVHRDSDGLPSLQGEGKEYKNQRARSDVTWQ